MATMNKVEVRSSCGGWKHRGGKTQSVPMENAKFENPQLSTQLCLEEGDDVEVFWRPSIDKEYLWYPAVIQSINWDQYFVCQFEHQKQKSVDIFEKKYIRLANPNPTFRVSHFVHTEIDIPHDLHDYCQIHPQCHKDLGKALNAVNLSYSKGKLTIITTEDVSKKMSVLREIHMRKLYERMYETFEKSEEKAPRKEPDFPHAYCEQVLVKPELMKLVIGHKGINIRRGKAIRGILDIIVDEQLNEIRIFAENKEAAQKARDTLEFCEKNYMVPKHLTSRIIGQKGKQIQEIIDKSKVIKVRFPSDQETREILSKDEVAKNTIIIFVGTKNNILNAECLMDYLVGSLAEIEQMSDDKNTIEKKTSDQLETHSLYNEGLYKRQGEGARGYNSTSGYSTDSSMSSTGRIRRRAGRRVQRARKNSDLARASAASGCDSASEFSISEFSEMSLSESDCSRSRSATGGKKTRRGSRGGKRKKPTGENEAKTTTKTNKNKDFVHEWVLKQGKTECAEQAPELDQVVEEMETESDEGQSVPSSGEVSPCVVASPPSTSVTDSSVSISDISMNSDELIDWSDEMQALDKETSRKDTPIPEDEEDALLNEFVSLRSVSSVSSAANQKTVCHKAHLLADPAEKIFSYAGAARQMSDRDRMEIINAKLLQLKEEERIQKEMDQRKSERTVVTTRGGRRSGRR